MRNEVSTLTISCAIGRHRMGPAGELADVRPIVPWFAHRSDPEGLQRWFDSYFCLTEGPTRSRHDRVSGTIVRAT
jgi:hypothetical protein